MAFLRGLIGRFTGAGGGGAQPAPEESPSFAPGAHPGDAELLAEDIRRLHDEGRYAEALALAGQLVDIRPSAATSVLLAQELHFCDRSAEALRVLSEVLAADPRNTDALRGRGLIQLHVGRAQEALDAYEQVLALAGETPAGLANRAAALQRLGRPDAALRDLDRALRLAPTDHRVLVNRVSVLIDQLRLQEARACALEALRLHPASAELHSNLSMAHLLLGELESGWAEREWRWRVGDRAAQAAPWAGPRWTGEDLAGRTIVLFAEQGFGDSIQFVRYVPQMARRAGTVLLSVPNELEGLLQDLAPNCRVLRAGEPLPPFDLQCPLMSVPGVVGTTLATIPAPARYLCADPARVQAWAKRLDDGSGRRTVGLVWSGNPAHVNDHNRSLPLQALRGLAATSCRFVSLQPQVRDSDQAAYAAWPGLLRFGEEVRDFADTAALVEALDVVVTVDTSVAHLAGALGRPAWLLLPYAPDWRWLTDREDSPWYPTARLFRQPAPGQWDAVVEDVRRALADASLQPPARSTGDAGEWLSRGNAALQKWDLPEAAECYRQAALADPSDPLAKLNRGFVALEQGSASAAIALLTQALAMRREGDGFAADAQFLLGRAYRLQEDPVRALAAFEAAAAERPAFAEAMEEAAGLLLQLRQYEAALSWAERLRQARPSAASALAVARVLCGLRRHAGALEILDAVLAGEPGNADAWSGRGEVLTELDRGHEALAAFERALEIAGPTPMARRNAATALARAGRAEEAAARLQEIVDEDPRNGDAANNQLITLLDLARPRAAVAAARRALELHPQDPDIHWALAVASLLLGDFESGWREHEWRWHSTTRVLGMDLLKFGRPSWLGTPDLAGRTILLFGEQGLGDSIQFLRFVPVVAARAKKVLICLPEGLLELAEAADLPANCELVPPGAAFSGFDLETPLMSLPLALGLKDEAALRQKVPYLRADPARVQAWQRRLAQHGHKLNVGVTWSGNPDHSNDRNRSIPLQVFRGLEAAGCRFVSLQPEVRERDLQAAQDWPQLLQWGKELRSFADTAALMEALDVVVAVDTSVAHLAGALGRPLRVLLPYSPDWRWMLEREDTPWYPAAKLRRQPAPGDWPSVLAALREELEALAQRAGRAG